jgi:hypothetical protein
MDDKEKKGRRKSGFLPGGVVGIMITVIVINVVPQAAMLAKLKQLFSGQDDIFRTEGLAEEHDVVLEDTGVLGYTVADFADAILGDGNQLTSLEVYERQVSDMLKITDAGLGNLKFFSKYQYITYNGEATYIVELGI